VSASYAELATSVYEASGEMLGPLSLADLVFGLQAVAKQHRQQGLSYSIHDVSAKGCTAVCRNLQSEAVSLSPWR
jgi:hypothetical protein